MKNNISNPKLIETIQRRRHYNHLSTGISQLTCPYCMDLKPFKNNGKGYHGDKAGHQKVGKMGGSKTFEKYGVNHYSLIGKKGGRVSPGNFKNMPERAAEAGRKGGLVRSKHAATKNV